MSPARLLQLPLLALLLARPAAAAPPEPRAVARAGGEFSGLVAYRSENRVEVAADGRRTDVAAPRTGRVDALARIDSGWLLAGTAPTATGSDLWLRRGDSGVTATVAPPGGRSATLRHDAVVFADDRSLLGLAWLEGDRRDAFEIRFSAWTGSGFGPPRLVAPRGRGSQLALAGAVLADGRMMLVWAGFDGQDDEIWASWTLGAGGWSAPRRVAADNRVPDITPDIVAEGTGALVAWSRFDGSEYQAVVARFDGDRFAAAQPVAGPGSVFPTFEGGAGRRGVLFSDARRGGWALSELDAAGMPVRQSRLSLRHEGERPLVRLGERGVEWRLGPDSEATAWE